MWEKAHLTTANSGNSQPRMLPIKLIFIAFRFSWNFRYSFRKAIRRYTAQSVVSRLDSRGLREEKKNNKQSRLLVVVSEAQNAPTEIMLNGSGLRAAAKRKKGRRINLSYGFYHNGRNKHFHFQLGSACHQSTQHW